MTVTMSESTYLIEYHQDIKTGSGEQCWVAEDPALPGAIGYGDTREEAAEMLDRSRRAFLQFLEEQGQPRPFRTQEGFVVHQTGGPAFVS